MDILVLSTFAWMKWQSDPMIVGRNGTGALAKTFAFSATPAMAIGRTVPQGEISSGMLKQIIDQERSNGPFDDC